MKKNDKRNLILAGVLGFGVYALASKPKKTAKDYEDEFDVSDVKDNSNENFINPSLAPKTYSIHWNNPSGIIKTGYAWECLGEVWKADNFTNFKAFNTITDGYSAQIYNLLSYIELGYDTVSKIVARWTGLKAGTTAFNNYVGATTFYPTDSIDTWDNLKIFSANQTFAESGRYANPKFFMSRFDFAYAKVKKCYPTLVEKINQKFVS